jgi:ABC-type transport system substrate-binding protein
MLQLEFNVRRPPLDSAAVRQGIAHAVDRAALVTSIGQPEDHSVWEDNDHLFANSEPGYNDDASGYETPDLNAAAHLLQQGGLVADAEGRWTSHGSPVDLTLVWADDDPWSEAVGPIVAAQLSAAGIGVSADPVPSSELFGAVLPGAAFDLAIVPVSPDAYPSAMDDVFSTAAALTGGGPTQDWSGFDDPKLDTLFTQAMEQLSVPQALAVYRQIDQSLWTSMPTLPLFAEPTLLVWSAAVTGVNDDPGGLGPLWNVRLWARLEAASTRTTSASGAGP